MIDVGIVIGSEESAKAVIFNHDTVYIHSDIEPLPADEQGNILYKYNEKQYTRDEYEALMSEKQSIETELLTLHDVNLFEIENNLKKIINAIENLNTRLEKLENKNEIK